MKKATKRTAPKSARKSTRKASKNAKVTKAKTKKPKAKPARKAAPKSTIRTKRAYDRAAVKDGMRILVDRLWPRGVTKSKLRIDSWPRHLAPSTELRRWYHAHPEKFAEFRKRYLAELKAQGESLAALSGVLEGRTVTLLTATRNIRRSHAEILRTALAPRR
jgi:uncharacterized protein YeaO (DUF488 family)